MLLPKLFTGAMPEGFGKGDYTDLVMQATSAALLPQKHYGTYFM